MRRPEKWYPIGVSFWRDERIVEVGRPAAILFQQCLGASKESGSLGRISLAQAKQLPEYTAGRWKALTTDTAVAPDKGPLIVELPLTKGLFYVPSHDKWNPSTKQAEGD